MPFRTKYGKHYHMTEGCHGATIPCDTKGLSPCSDCCGPDAGSKTGAGAGASASIPAGTTVIHGRGHSVSVDGTVIETRKVGYVSPLKDGVMYRLDTKLSDEQRAALGALPGVIAMPGEYSLDGTERTDAIIVNDLAGYSLDYARTVSDLGLRALGEGFDLTDDIDTNGVAAWLARNKDNDWESTTLPFVLDDEAEPTHHLWNEDDPDEGGFTRYPLRDTGDDLRRLNYIHRVPGMRLSYGRTGTPVAVLIVDGYEAVARKVGGKTILGVRRHYDTPIMDDAGKADWEVVRSDYGGDTIQADGVAYRTPAGDARITMMIEPDPYFPGETQTSIWVEDPFLGQRIPLAMSVMSGDIENAKGRTCQYYLDQANLGPRRSSFDIRSAYRKALPDIARREAEQGDTIVEGVTRVSDREVEVRVLEGGYEPRRRRAILEEDGSISWYAK